MSIIMSRSGAEFWWNKIGKKNIEIPRNVVHYSRQSAYHDWQVTTWEDIHKKRTEQIILNVERKRSHEVVKPCLVWVFSHGYWLMGGYYTTIKTIHEEYYLNFRRRGLSTKVNKKKLQLKVMQVFPLGILPIEENFYIWMELFAKYFNNTKFYKGWKNQGIAKAHCKLDESGNLLDIML